MARKIPRPVSNRTGLGLHERKDKRLLVRFERAAVFFFFFLRRLWFNNIPKETIHNYYTSFLVRCKTCYDIGENSLNGHWKQVKSYHDQYRTGLLFVQDFFTKQLRPIEIPITINNSE